MMSNRMRANHSKSIQKLAIVLVLLSLFVVPLITSAGTPVQHPSQGQQFRSPLLIANGDPTGVQITAQSRGAINSPANPDAAFLAVANSREGTGGSR